jgi:nucleoside-diphosphate-sugar epimerase
MPTKKILVTGAGGFIGRHSIPILERHGYEIHGLHYGDAPTPKIKSVKWHVVNLLERGVIGPLISGIKPQYLIHFAWEARPGIYWTSETNSAWARTSVELFETFYKQGGLRGVSAGSCAEYSWKNEGLFSEERTPALPATLYGTSKLNFAQSIRRFSIHSGFSYAWGRIFYPFGPGEYRQRLVPSVILSLLAGEPAKATHGRQIRDFLYVEEVAGAFVALLESECQGPVNIASGIGTSVSDIVLELGKLVGRTDLIHLGEIPLPAGEPASLVANTDRLNSTVGFVPKIDIHNGLRKTFEWWRANQ